MDTREMERQMMRDAEANSLQYESIREAKQTISIGYDEYKEFIKWKKQKTKKPRFRDLKKDIK